MLSRDDSRGMLCLSCTFSLNRGALKTALRSDRLDFPRYTAVHDIDSRKDEIYCELLLACVFLGSTFRGSTFLASLEAKNCFGWCYSCLAVFLTENLPYFLVDKLCEFLGESPISTLPIEDWDCASAGLSIITSSKTWFDDFETIDYRLVSVRLFRICTIWSDIILCCVCKKLI